MCVYIYIRYVMNSFGGYKKSFSWLGQKVNKKIDAYDHVAEDSGTDYGHGMIPHHGKSSR